MTSRLWRGLTTPKNTAAYEAVVRGEAIPAIATRPREPSDSAAARLP